MNDVPIFVVALLPGMLTLLGFGLWWYCNLLDDRAHRAVRIGAGALLAIGVLSLIFISTLPFFIVVLPVLVVLGIAALSRYRHAESHTLLWGLMSAAQREIPLDAAARAFAGERSDRIGGRISKLADYLEAGVPLGLALRRSGLPADPGVVFAADLGSQTGMLGPALRGEMEQAESLGLVTAPIAARSLYVGSVVVYTLVVLVFLELKTFPVFTHLVAASKVQPPTGVEQISAFGLMDKPEHWWVVAFTCLGGALVVAGVGALWGWSPRNWPLVSRMWLRVDAATVLRWLAVGVGQGKPIVESMQLIAGYAPWRRVRSRLEQSVQRTVAGGHWSESLAAVGLLRDADSAVLRAAERAGNLSWALNEMADSSVRRWRYRILASSNLLLPVALVVLSITVAWIAVEVFTPLVTLIQENIQ